MGKKPKISADNKVKIEDFRLFSTQYSTQERYIKFLNNEEKVNSLQNFLDNPKECNWTYEINQYGYRGKNWRLDPNTKKIGFFGCSITFGQGLDEPYIFPSLVEQFYGPAKVECINFGHIGSSTHRIARTLSAAVSMINFDAVIITLPSLYRFLITDSNNEITDVVPNSAYDNVKHKQEAIFKYFTDADFQLFAGDNIAWMKSELKGHDKVLWCTWCDHTYEILKQHISDDAILPSFTSDGPLARDNIHPGKIAHAKQFRNIVKKLGKSPWG